MSNTNGHNETMIPASKLQAIVAGAVAQALEAEREAVKEPGLQLGYNPGNLYRGKRGLVTKATMLRLPIDTYNDIKAIASKKGIRPRDVVVRAVDAYLRGGR